ncbi:MAG: recombinase family protein [bacterium]|nr:recombinase family protein [bacterium]
MGPVLAYFRVSTEEQSEKGQSIETQRKLCRKWASDNGYQIVGEYADEGRSGTNLNRPALQELLARCQQEGTVQAVLVQDTDRLARNTYDHLTVKAILKKAGARLISISQPMLDDSPEGSFIDVVMAGANALQSQITGRKTSKVLEQKAQAGYWPGWSPLGYKNSENSSPSSNLDRHISIPDPELSSLIKRMFELYATGSFSALALRDSLYQQGLRTKMGKMPQVSIIIRCLKNPFYYGVIPFKSKIYPGKHEPLTDKATFDACQLVMASHNQYACRRRKYEMILRGFLFCKNCGHRFWGGPCKKNRYYYYFCKSCGGGTYVIASKLEREVEKRFADLEVTPEYAEEVVEVAKNIVLEMRQDSGRDRLSLSNKKASIEAKMREAEDRLLDKTLSREAFKSIYGRLEVEMREVNDQLVSLDVDYSQSLRSLEKLMSLAENIGQTYKEATPDLKRMYIGLFFERFLVEEGSIVEAVPSAALKPLLGSKVRVRANWLRGQDSDL